MLLHAFPCFSLYENTCQNTDTGSIMANKTACIFLVFMNTQLKSYVCLD